jgi:hypothetical protein
MPKSIGFYREAVLYFSQSECVALVVTQWSLACYREAVSYFSPGLPRSGYPGEESFEAD